tara:strand:+ start:929 stop:1351 length:423 start_codon:yes stop_codon:yes gene_type:complete
MIKSAKLYFTDVGLATYCLDIHNQEQLARDPLRGNLVENFIISEILKKQMNKGVEPSMYFYRDSNQREIDLLIKTGNQLTPIEIKASKTFHQDFIKGLNYFLSIAEDRVKDGFVIYAGDRQQKIKNWQIINFHQMHKLFE